MLPQFSSFKPMECSSKGTNHVSQGVTLLVIESCDTKSMSLKRQRTFHNLCRIGKCRLCSSNFG